MIENREQRVALPESGRDTGTRLNVFSRSTNYSTNKRVLTSSTNPEKEASPFC